MATQTRNRSGRNRRKNKLKFWFIDGNLHLTLHINRPGDLITAWSYPPYPNGKRVGYSYAYILQHHQPGFTLQEVAKMINRHRVTLENAILDGVIERPQYTYNIESKRIHKYMLREEQVLMLHNYFSELHHGNARSDKLITPWPPLPTARELRAMMRHGEVYYVKTDEGFKPTWKAGDFG